MAELPSVLISVEREGGKEGGVGVASRVWQPAQGGGGTWAWHPSVRYFWFWCSGLSVKRLSLPTSIPRLIKGDGEVLEEIVTKERHREINKVGVAPLPRPTPSSSSDLSPPVCFLPQQATRGDGLAFQMRAGLLP